MNAFDRLNEIKDEMIQLLQEADQLIRINGNHFTYDRWCGYVKGHIASVLNNDHDYLSRNSITFESIINEMPLEDDEEEEEEEEEDN